MSTFYVVSVLRDRYYWPKLTVVVEGRFKTESAADSFITRTIRAQYEKRRGGRWSQYSSMRVRDMRVVDAVGLKRLQAAAKATATVRRKRAAKKAAITRLRNRGVQVKVDRSTLAYTIIPKKQPTLAVPVAQQDFSVN